LKKKTLNYEAKQNFSSVSGIQIISDLLVIDLLLIDHEPKLEAMLEALRKS